MPLADERALLARAQSSAAGFGELFDAYYDRIYAYAYRRVGSREAAEDIAASVFEDALRGIKRVRWQGKPVIAWLYRVAARRVVDHYRRARQDAPLESVTLRAAAPRGDLYAGVERAEEFAAVQRGLAKLSERDREVIRLVYFDEFSAPEIAAVLECTVNNMYVRLHRATMKLKGILNDETN